MQPAIKVESLSKVYTRRQRGSGFWGKARAYFSSAVDETRAVDGLSFSIERGESVGLIGENGAGKSTTVKMLIGILVASSGSVSTLGLDPWKQRRQLAMNIGVVFGQKPQLLWDIPAGESFKLLKAMYRIPDEVYRYTFNEAVQRLELTELLKTPVRLLSLGQRMRCDLAAALLHAPLVAFLDEPTIGLDVLVKESVREFLVEMRKRYGTTILLTTHDLKDISATCERLIVLDKGKLLYDGDLNGFQAKFATDRTVLVDLASDVASEAQAQITTELGALQVTSVWESPRRLRIGCKEAAQALKVTALVLERLPVIDLALQAADIDAIVTQLYRHKPSGVTQ